MRTPLFPSCCFTIETIDRKWAAPLELHSRSGAVRNRVAPGVPSGAPVARSDRQAETPGAVILCSSPWFCTHLLLPASRQAARALRRTNDLETCVAPIGSKMSRRSHWLKYTPKVFMPPAKALNLAGTTCTEYVPKIKFRELFRNVIFPFADGEYLMVFCQIRPAAQID